MGDQVTIVDIKMPFMSMVIFMVKAAIASIPAVVILSVIGSITFALLGMTMGPVESYFAPQQF